MTVRKGLGQANILRTNNNTSTGYGIAYADEVSGHRTVGNLTALYALNDWQLSASGDNTGSDAVGQLWYVVNADGNGNGCYYQLKDWSKRKEAAGWSEFKGTGASTAAAVTFDNTASGMTAVTAQGAIDELSSKLKNAGYFYAGIATPTTNPGTPDGTVFYIANGKGTYTNFGGINVTEDEVVVLYYDTEWHKVSTGIASQAKLSELEDELTIKGEGFDWKVGYVADNGQVTIFETKPNSYICLEPKIYTEEKTYTIPEGMILVVKKGSSATSLSVVAEGSAPNFAMNIKNDGQYTSYSLHYSDLSDISPSEGINAALRKKRLDDIDNRLGGLDERITNLEQEGNDVITIEENLFDKNSALTKVYIDGSGELHSENYSCVSDYILVEKGNKYTFVTNRTTLGAGGTNVVWYNNDKSYGGRILGSYVDTTSQVIFTAPQDCYIRCNMPQLSIENAMFVRGEIYPTKYISFGIHKSLNEEIEVHAGNPLYGKRFVMVGDSICAGQNVGSISKSWVEIIGSNNDMIATNKGIGGSTLRTKEGKANIVDRTMGLDTNNYDYIIVQGGVNDMAENLGSWIKPTSGGASDYPSLASLDRSTTYGAMEYLCKYCMINFPTKKFGFIITYRGTERTWNNVSENIKGICEKYGMPYIDLRSCGGFNLLDPEIRAVYGMSSDYKQTYNSELGYKLDEQAIYNGKVYKANEAITAPAGSFDESKWTYIADVGGYDSWHCNYTAYLQSAKKIEAWMKTL